MYRKYSAFWLALFKSKSDSSKCDTVEDVLHHSTIKRYCFVNMFAKTATDTY